MLLAGVPLLRGSDVEANKRAEAIFETTGVPGGLVVHLGFKDGRVTAALRQNESCVVHGLGTDKEAVQRARDYLQSLGLYGPVTVEFWKSPRLPHADNVVNLLVAESGDLVATSEIMRVLVPQGVAYVRKDDAWIRLTKPPLTGVDEWTHYLHDASGNPVAHDAVVGPPGHLQWSAAPRHSRSHEFTPSISTVVSTGGRIFYIVDEGPTSTLWAPSTWKLVARDAYNGLRLWERPIGKWYSHLSGWTQGPRQLQRKLVAVGDRVYTTLGYHAPLVALDAANGETVRVYSETDGAEEILWQNGILLLVVREVTDLRREAYRQWETLAGQAESPLHLRDTRLPLVNAFRRIENQAPISLVALDATSGEVLWKKDPDQAASLRSFSLRACGDRVYCEMHGRLHCMELATGKARWSTEADRLRAVSDDAVVCVSKKSITLRSPEDGRLVWSRPLSLDNVRDVLLAGGALWLGGGRPYDTGNKRHTGSSWGPYFAVGRDLQTGEIIREITADNPGHHHRCYESKATDRYILGGRRGTEFLDLESGDYLWHSWARGTCRYGVMPCNGLLYVPPHACGCYITAKLMGFNALAPARSAAGETPAVVPEGRLEKGPAFGMISHDAAAAVDDWPTYRGDAERSSLATCQVPVDLRTKWNRELGAGTTPPTIAGGKLYVARPDVHQLLALDSTDGTEAWSFTTGGRIDSPPTIHAGRALFGCRDGYVYSLRAVDGALDWRFHAAHQPRRVVIYDQLESASPVHGSVLLDHGTLTFTAGRSSFLDGGLGLYRMNPETGQMLSKTVIYSPDPETGRQPQQYGPNGMPGARSDILVADDDYLYLRDLTFSKLGQEVTDRKPHLFTLTDFLDDSGAHRSYWIFGTKSSLSTGCSGRDRKLLYGRLLAFNDKSVLGYGRAAVHWSSEFEDGEYRLFARHRDADKPHWSRSVPVHIRTIVLSGDIVFAAGAGPAPGQAPAKQEVSREPLLMAFSAADGSELARYPMPAAPVFNGMAAAGGELLLTLENGQVLCMTAK
jgi:outer membrane protein assembly factor BamB